MLLGDFGMGLVCREEYPESLSAFGDEALLECILLIAQLAGFVSA